MSYKNWQTICNEFSAARSPTEFKIISRKFQEKETLSEKVELLYELFQEDNLLQKFRRIPGKSYSDAVTRRKEGNYAFCRKKFAEALKLYAESVAAAPKDSEEQALAYSNRSAALCRLEKFASALIDVNRALMSKHLEFLHIKLQRRKKECIDKIRSGEAEVSPLLMSFSKLSLGNVESSSEIDFDEDMCDVNYNRKLRVPLPDFKNKLIPNSSEKIKLHETKEMGRLMVASQDIMPGELLICAEPYIISLFPEFYFTHCSHCASPCDILISCDGCSLVMFCGELCKNESMQSYHRMECQFLSFALTLEKNKVELQALRLLMKITKQGADLCRMMAHPILRDPTARRGLNVNKVFRPEDSITIHNFKDNFDRMPACEKAERAAMAATLLHILKQSTYFDEAHKNLNISSTDSGKKLTKVESFVGGLLLKYLCALNCNSHYIGSIVKPKLAFSRDVLTTEGTSIGGAVYPVLNFMNHSCDSNVYRLISGTHTFLYSLQPITAGQQIFDDYGANYLAKIRSERQFFLKDQYYFDCKCDACKFGWPLYPALPRQKPKYLSKKLFKTKKLKASSKRFSVLLEKSLSGVNVEGEWDFFRDHLTLLHRSIQRPWGEYADCQEILRHLLHLKFENIQKLF